MSEPDTQAQPPAAGEGGNPEGKGQPNEGFQQRINELTAARRQAEERASQIEQKYFEMSAQIAKLMENQTAPRAEVEPPPDLDPVQRQQLDAYIDQKLGGALKRLEHAVGRQELNADLNAGRQAAEVFGDPELLKRSEALIADLRSKGIPVSAENVVDMLAGQKARAERLEKLKAEAARNGWNGGYQVLTQQGGVRPAGAVPVGAPVKTALSSVDPSRVVGTKGMTAAKLAELADSMPDMPL